MPNKGIVKRPITPLTILMETIHNYNRDAHIGGSTNTQSQVNAIFDFGQIEIGMAFSSMIRICRIMFLLSAKSLQ
jgi:hypothetical protein